MAQNWCRAALRVGLLPPLRRVWALPPPPQIRAAPFASLPLYRPVGLNRLMADARVGALLLLPLA